MIADRGAEWNDHFVALNGLRAIAKHAPGALAGPGTDIHQLMLGVCAACDSPRSTLSKCAIVAVGDMFNFVPELFENEAPTAVQMLLKKASEASVFLNENVNASLDVRAAACWVLRWCVVLVLVLGVLTVHVACHSPHDPRTERGGERHTDEGDAAVHRGVPAQEPACPRARRPLPRARHAAHRAS